jgi:hypothetical protein
MDLWSTLEALWREQEEFNRYAWQDREMDLGEDALRDEQTRAFVLGMISELDELMRCTIWDPARRPHRRPNEGAEYKPNRAQVKSELADLLKYLISLCIAWKISPGEAVEAFWNKSMVCRQRMSEEMVDRISIHDRIAIVDIDSVLCDYRAGFLQWIINYAGVPEQTVVRAEQMLYNPQGSDDYWVSHISLRMDLLAYENLKHQFRTGPYKRNLPSYPDAEPFTRRLRDSGRTIVLLTSRPIDKYPNIYAETLLWLKQTRMQFKALWWSNNKFERVSWTTFTEQVDMVVDDDLSHLEKFAERLGDKAKCYWVNRGAPGNVRVLDRHKDRIIPVTTLEEIPA